MKKRRDIRIESNLRDGLDQQVAHSGQQLTAIVERYVRKGLASNAWRDAGIGWRLQCPGQ